MRDKVTGARRWVVKIGSALLTADGRGLVNYSALEAQKIIGQPSDAIEKLLGYVDEPELVHRDNLILV